MAQHLLVDLENTQPIASAVADWIGAEGKAWIFYGPHQHKLPASFQALGDRVTLIPISRPGANSLDFHLVFYLGYLAAGNPKSNFTVLAKDTGYDPAIAHARLLTFAVKRISALGSVPTNSGLKESVKTTRPRPATISTKSPAAAKTSAAKKSLVAKKAAPANKLAAAKVPTAAKKVAKTVPAPRAAAPVAEPVATKSTAKPAIAIYRGVLADLRGPNRPRTLTALARHIQSRVGNTPAPAKVQAVIDHLKTTDAIRLVDGKLVYFPNDRTTVPAKS
jgi:hypothetical protein